MEQTCPSHICESCGKPFKHFGSACHSQICITCSIRRPQHCSGHKCKSCGKIYHHKHECIHPILDHEGHGSFTGICPDCTNECCRKEALKEIVNNQRPLTAREEVEIAIEHESVVKLMCDKPDWREQISAHITDMEKKIQSFRIKIATSRHVRGQREMEEFSKMTPEEIEDWRREQKKDKKPKDEDKIRQTKIQRAIESFVKQGIPREMAKKLVNSKEGKK